MYSLFGLLNDILGHHFGEILFEILIWTPFTQLMLFFSVLTSGSVTFLTF